MSKPFNRRIDQAEKIAAGAFSAFERAMEEFELASNLQRQVYDDIQREIDRLSVMAGEAEELGRRAQHRAEKLREFFE